ncbi:hypothetical protein B0H66DRAFT_628976 [Apodospora peruviana]|uniref:Uncharacterized protein n=1 Tax=Apodospora peruviana TaxID=516989 RepID=A0AAE0HUU7_9PEZI|nr:hypothetical protein B0H66DRAFT_628976 [Apodospora peruviana]
MTSFTLFLSLVWLLFSGQVWAGSAIWQPALKPRDHDQKLDPRYYYVNKDTMATDRIAWDKRVIRYCFSSDDATQAAKSRLKKYLKDARKLWISKGLNSNFRIEEVNDKVCVDERNDILLVVYSGDSESSGMATYVGFPGKGVVMLANQGPTMTLTDRSNMGLLDVVANFAHELGHAWGLYHEHQNPKFWGEGVAGSDGGEVWGPNNPGGWNCHYLKDYARQVTGLVVQTGNGGMRQINQQSLCTNWAMAAANRFSAADYLPMPNVGTAHSAGHGTNNVDWRSIMIYPSGAGAIATESGPITADNDHRERILQKPDGSRIPINLFPSDLDIAALEAMYASVGGTKLDLLNTISNFKKVYKSSNSGPSGGSGCL